MVFKLLEAQKLEIRGLKATQAQIKTDVKAILTCIENNNGPNTDKVPKPKFGLAHLLPIDNDEDLQQVESLLVEDNQLERLVRF